MWTSVHAVPNTRTMAVSGNRTIVGGSGEVTIWIATKLIATSFATSPTVRPNAKGSRSCR
jgi:hypothetical protein